MKKCPICNSIITGRSDKKFCSVKCKSAHQYETRQKNEAFYLYVDKQLKTNRKILKRFNVKGYSTVRKSDLTEAGFDPKYFTHYWKNKEGKVYLFCYDYGFLELSKNNVTKYLLVEWQTYMNRT